MGKILSVNSFTGITETFHEVDNKVIIHKTADITKELENNKREINSKVTGWKGGWHKVASVPTIIIEKWREELKAKGASDVNPLSANNKPFLIAKLNDRNFALDSFFSFFVSVIILPFC